MVKSESFVPTQNEMGYWAPQMLQFVAEIQRYSDQYAPFMEAARVNRGWIFDWRQTTDLIYTFGIVAPIVYAIKPGTNWFKPKVRGAQSELYRVRWVYGNKTIMVMVADTDLSSGWNVGPIQQSELWLAPQVIATLRDDAKTRGTFERWQMLHRTLLIQEKCNSL